MVLACVPRPLHPPCTALAAHPLASALPAPRLRVRRPVGCLPAPCLRVQRPCGCLPAPRLRVQRPCCPSHRHTPCCVCPPPFPSLPFLLQVTTLGVCFLANLTRVDRNRPLLLVGAVDAVLGALATYARGASAASGPPLAPTTGGLDVRSRAGLPVCMPCIGFLVNMCVCPGQERGWRVWLWCGERSVRTLGDVGQGESLGSGMRVEVWRAPRHPLRCSCR